MATTSGTFGPAPDPTQLIMLNFIKEMSSIVSQLKDKLALVTKERDHLKIQNSKCHEVIKSLKDELENVKKDAMKHVYTNLNGLFTQNQIDSIVHCKRVHRWKEEDISKAVTLRSLSPKAYRFLREKWNFPLPSFSTISRWISGINVEPGVLSPMMNLLQHKASTMSQQERLCVISFDECSISQEWCYDMGVDTLYDPKH